MPHLEIIAELAQGFEGRAEQARLLVKAAAAAGADAAKFQLVYADELATADYQHYRLFKSLEMADQAWEDLAACARESGIGLQLDIFGRRSLDLAERIGAAAVKLHPTDLANAGLLDAVARSGATRVLLGAGGALASEIEPAVAALRGKPVTVLLGFQGYPTPDDANQIARIGRLAEWLGARGLPDVLLGFADHASPESPLRYALAATAVGAGARVIEKHLTLGRNMRLEDHESALNPDEFGEFVRVLRACADGVGEAAAADDFGMSDKETRYRTTIRRHVVAARSLAAGTAIAPGDVALKRTSADRPIGDLTRAYGRRLSRDLPQDAPVLQDDLD